MMAFPQKRSPRVKWALCCTLVALCLLLPPAISLAGDSIHVAFVGKLNSKNQQKLVKQMQQQLQNRAITVAVDTYAADTFFSAQQDDSNYDLIVTVGKRAVDLLEKQTTQVPTISTFTSSMAYDDTPLPHHSAIFIDQPAARYLALIKEVLPYSRTVSLLYSDYSEPFYQQLTQAAIEYQLTINGKKVSKTNDIYSALDNVVKNSDVLLAIPDPTIYNRHTIKTIFLTSYQDEVPIIGFSRSYTKAGAISSLHSDISDISKQLAESIAYFIKNSKKLPEASYPSYFHVSTNPKVANSLSIPLDGPETLLQKIVAKSR